MIRDTNLVSTSYLPLAYHVAWYEPFEVWLRRAVLKARRRADQDLDELAEKLGVVRPGPTLVEAYEKRLHESH